jgi:hypothetical protein
MLQKHDQNHITIIAYLFSVMFPLLCTIRNDVCNCTVKPSCLIKYKNELHIRFHKLYLLVKTMQKTTMFPTSFYVAPKIKRIPCNNFKMMQDIRNIC